MPIIEFTKTPIATSKHQIIILRDVSVCCITRPYSANVLTSTGGLEKRTYTDKSFIIKDVGNNMCWLKGSYFNDKDATILSPTIYHCQDTIDPLLPLSSLLRVSYRTPGKTIRIYTDKTSTRYGYGYYINFGYSASNTREYIYAKDIV